MRPAAQLWRGDSPRSSGSTRPPSTGPLALVVRLGRVQRTAREYRDWTRTIIAWQHPSGVSKPTRPEDARRAAITAGALPPEAAEMPIPTFYKVRRELDLVPRAKRSHRLSAELPMQVCLVDASGSEYLVVDGPYAGDETRLKLHLNPLPQAGYKNKPVSRDRLRCWVYALWDMCTGVYRARYCVARGENALDAASFVCWALKRSVDRRVVLHGVPERGLDLWSDLGPLGRSADAVELLDRLNITPVLPGGGYQKERMGGVEKTHSVRWAFERTFFYLGRKASLTLAEVNARLQEFEVRENRRRPARMLVDGKRLSRNAAWVALTNQRPKGNPLRLLPEDPMDTMANVARRKIDVNGIVRWGGVEYESKDWHDRWVIAYRAATGPRDTLTIEDEVTRKRQTIGLVPRGRYGEIRTAPATALEQLRAEDAGVDRKSVDLFAPATGASVVPIPARTAPAAHLENPLDATRCRDADEGMWVFDSHFTQYCREPLTAEQRAKVEAHIQGGRSEPAEDRRLGREVAAGQPSVRLRTSR